MKLATANGASANKKGVDPMNVVHFIGRVGNHPEVQTFASGKTRARFPLGVEIYTNGEKETMWLSCEMWEKNVENLSKCQEKTDSRGRLVQISGQLSLNSYNVMVGSEQRKVKRFFLKVEKFTFLDYLKNLEPKEAVASEAIDAEAAEASEPAPMGGEPERPALPIKQKRRA